MMTGNQYHPLVPGSVRDIFDGQKLPEVWLQVIYSKAMGGENGGPTTRYKVAVSDSRNFIQAMVVLPMAQAFEQKLVDQWSIIRVTSYQLSTLKGHTFMVMANMSMDDVIKTGHKYGEPTNIETPADNLQPKPTAAPAETPMMMPPTTSIPTPPVVVNKPSPFQSNIGNPPPSVATGGGGGGGFHEEPESLQTIANLSPYHNRWAIKARIVNKSDIKKFANAKGEGKLFSATCIDNTSEIRMTGFGECVDKFFDLVQEGQVYYISNAQVKIAKRQFGVRNEYEIHLEPSSLITLAREGGESLPSARYSFVPISHVVNLEKDSNCDVIGVVREVGELSSIVTKTTQKNLSKRDLTIGDTSNCSIRVTLWGAQAENFHDAGNNPIIAIKGARVSDYNGRTLSTSGSSTVAMNPDIKEAYELRGWFDSQGVHETARSLSSGAAAATQMKDDRKTVAQIKDEFLGTGEKPDWFSLMGTITFIKSDGTISYPACPTENCGKKVFEDGPNMWRCEKCQKVFDRCDHRYILSLQVADHTGQSWFSAYNDFAQELLGKSAEEMYYLKASDESAFSTVFKDALFKQFLFRCRAKQESYQGENKVRLNIQSAAPISPTEESKLLIQNIEKRI